MNYNNCSVFLKTKHIAQLCIHLFCLASADEFFGKAIVGLLIDSHSIRFCTIVAGVIFQVSPPMLWRAGTTVVVETLAIMMTVIFYMNLQLLTVTPPDAKEYMKKIGLENRVAKMVIHPPTPLLLLLSKRLFPGWMYMKDLSRSWPSRSGVWTDF